MVWSVSIPEDSKIVISSEHDAYEWVAPAEAAKRLTHKYPADFCNAIAKL